MTDEVKRFREVEQELRALADSWSGPASVWVDPQTARALAQGYLALLAERDEKDGQIEALKQLLADARAEREALKAQAYK